MSGNSINGKAKESIVGQRGQHFQNWNNKRNTTSWANCGIRFSIEYENWLKACTNTNVSSLFTVFDGVLASRHKEWFTNGSIRPLVEIPILVSVILDF